MASLCKLVKRGAVRANDLPLSNDLEAWPDGSVGRAPTYKVRGREFESRSGRLFSRTFTFKIKYSSWRGNSYYFTIQMAS